MVNLIDGDLEKGLSGKSHRRSDNDSNNEYNK